MSRQMAAPGDEPGRVRAPRGPAVTTVLQQYRASSFPDHLLAIVYSMLASLRGRVCFAAVCQSWRAAAHAAPPAASLPWLLLSCSNRGAMKHLHCPEENVIVRVTVPSWMWIVGCYDGGWVISALVGPLRIVNFFSGAEVALSEKQQSIVCTSNYHGSPDCPVIMWKIVFSDLPTSGDCILAAKTLYCGIALCRVGSPDGGWTTQGCSNEELADIVFCKGELYGLKFGGTLVKFEIGVNDHGAPMVTGEHRLAVKHPVFPGYNYCSYIFDLHGKLAMALRTRWSPSLQPFFKVFELVDTHGGGLNARYKHKWLEVTSLGDHALFLGKTFSKVVHVPAKTRSGVERNCIYYSSNCFFDQHSVTPSDTVLLTISNDYGDQTYYRKYKVADDDVQRISSVGYITKDYLNGSMWILPPDI